MSGQPAVICEWTEDEDGNWDTECGEKHTFIDGGPRENGAKFCCYCGFALVAVKFTEEPVDA